MAPVPTTNTLPAIDAQISGEVHVLEQRLFFPTLRSERSKDNIINTESTKKIDPTKRLDKVDDATGRIVYNIANTSTLEINNITLLKEGTIKIGHFEHKMQLFTNDSRA